MAVVAGGLRRDKDTSILHQQFDHQHGIFFFFWNKFNFRNYVKLIIILP